MLIFRSFLDGIWVGAPKFHLESLTIGTSRHEENALAAVSPAGRWEPEISLVTGNPWKPSDGLRTEIR